MVASLLMALGLNPFVAMLSVGFLAVLFFRQGAHGIAVKTMAGAGLGALAGVLWFAVSSILEVLIVTFAHKGPEIRTELIAKIQQTASQTNDPQVLALFDKLKTPSGVEVLILTGLMFAFLAAIVLGSIGGALGASLLGGRNRS